MEENLKLVLEYYEEMRQYDFFSHREKILSSMIQTLGLYHALRKKGIITEDEWSEGISTMQNVYSKERHEVEEKVRIHEENARKIDEKIKAKNKEQENMKKTIKDIFGIDL